MIYPKAACVLVEPEQYVDLCIKYRLMRIFLYPAVRNAIFKDSLL